MGLGHVAMAAARQRLGGRDSRHRRPQRPREKMMQLAVEHAGGLLLVVVEWMMSTRLGSPAGVQG